MSVSGRRTFPAVRTISGWQITTFWANCPLWISQPSQLSLPSLLSQQISSNLCNNMNYGNTIKRQWCVLLYDCRSKSVGAGLDCGPDRTPALSVTHSAAAAAVCGFWRYISVIPLPVAKRMNALRMIVSVSVSCSARSRLMAVVRWCSKSLFGVSVGSFATDAKRWPSNWRCTVTIHSPHNDPKRNDQQFQ